MVYKKYIKRNGKIFGPYYYSSYRKGDKVKTAYFRVKEKYQNETKKRKLFTIAAGFLVMVALFFFIKPSIIGLAIEGTSFSISPIQSHPVVGGNWTIEIDTKGKANLTITPINGTTWSDINEDNQLRFLEIKCGEQILGYEWVNNSIFIENYTCDKIGYEISKVLTVGKHTLEFRFGDEAAYAYNTGEETKRVSWNDSINSDGSRSWYSTYWNGSDYIPMDVKFGNTSEWYYLKLPYNYIGFNRNNKGAIGVANGEGFIANVYPIAVAKHPTNLEYYLCPLVDVPTITGMGHSGSTAFHEMHYSGYGSFTCYQYNNYANSANTNISINKLELACGINGKCKISADITFTDFMPADTGFGFLFVPVNVSKFRYAYISGSMIDLTGLGVITDESRTVEFFDELYSRTEINWDWGDMFTQFEDKNLTVKPHFEIVEFGGKKGLLAGSYGYGPSHNIIVDPTLEWDTAAECNINTTQSYNNETIIATCNVIVNGATGGVLNFQNVTFYMNETSSSQWDFIVQAGATLNTNDSTQFLDYNGSAGAPGGGYNYYIDFYGNSSLKNTTLCDDTRPRFRGSSVNNLSNVTIAGESQSIYFWDSSSNNLTNVTIGTAYIYFEDSSVNTITNSTFEGWTYFIENSSNTVKDSWLNSMTIRSQTSNTLTIENLAPSNSVTNNFSSTTTAYKVNLTNVDIDSIYFSARENSINTLINVTIDRTWALLDTSQNTITDSIFQDDGDIYGTSKNTITNTNFTTSYRRVRFYGMPNTTFNKPYSSILNIRIDNDSAVNNPEIHGYLNLTNLVSWDPNATCNRYFPIYVYYEGTADPVNNANVTIMQNGTNYTNSGLTNASGYVELNITFDNATGGNLYNFALFVDDVDKGNITFLNDTSPDGIILYAIAPPNVTLSSPANASTDTDGNITFQCNVTDNVKLVNISLYTNSTGTWHRNQTINVTNFTEWYTPVAIYNKCGEESPGAATSMIDDNTNTYWRHASTENHSIAFDMGQTYNITRVRVYHVQYMSNLHVNAIYISDDPTNWGSSLGSTTGGVNYYYDSDGWDEIDITDKSGRYINLTSTNGSDIYWYEFDAYGFPLIPASYNASFNVTGLSDGTYIWNCLAYDNDSNSDWGDANWTVNVLIADTTAPTITNMTISPSAAADVDPNVNINVTVNVTDAGGVNTTILRYWNYSTNVSTSSNVTMSSAGGNMYNASFTPDVNGTWYYQVWANDSAGNSINNTPNSTDVQYDCTWHVNDTIATVSLGVFGTTKDIGNFTINNTGDAPYWNNNCTLSFLASDNLAAGRIVFNTSTADKSVLVQTVSANSTYTSNITATFLTTATSESLTITITEWPGGISTSPSSTTVNSTLTSYAGGAYLEVTINGTPSTVNQTSSQNFTLSAYAKNIGNDTAENVTLNWTLPTGWSNVSGQINLSTSALNCSDPTISPSRGCTTNASLNTLVNVVIATINPATASLGAVTIYANSSSINKTNASCTTNCSYINASASTTITVNCYNVSDGTCGNGCTYDSTASNYDPDCTAPTVTTVTTVGGGGGGVPAPAVIVSEAIYELIRGKDESFSLEVKNPFDNAYLREIKMKVAGFLAQYISIEPPTLDSIPPNSSFNFTIRIVAPAYFVVGQHNLTFTIDSVKEVGVTKTTRTEKRYITLVIHELGREDAAQLIALSKDYIEKMRVLELNIKGVRSLLEQSQEALEKSDYEKVQELCAEIESIAKAALESHDKIIEMEKKIEDAEKSGVRVEDTRRMIGLAKAASERGDFALALERAKDAEVTFALETKGEFNLFYFIAQNTLQFFFGLIVTLALLTVLFLRVKLSIINSSLGGLHEEEGILLGLMKTIQHECFAEKKLSIHEYYQTMLQYEDRFSKTIQRIVELESAKVNLLRFKKAKLELERKRLLDLMKETQHQYIKEKQLDTRVYERRMHSYATRLSEIEEELATREAERALRRDKLRRFLQFAAFLKVFKISKHERVKRLEEKRKKKALIEKLEKEKERVRREDILKKLKLKEAEELKRKAEIEKARREGLEKRFLAIAAREEKKQKRLALEKKREKLKQLKLQEKLRIKALREEKRREEAEKAKREKIEKRFLAIAAREEKKQKRLASEKAKG